jgi:hypothetical protein
MSVGDDFIEELLRTSKDDRYSFPILALLFPNMDYINNDFHKDHLHPISSFNEANANKMGLSGKEREVFLSREWHDSIINLQMLDSNENMAKQDKELKAWINSEVDQGKRANLMKNCIIPEYVSLELKDFPVFAEARKEQLAIHLKKLLE